MRKTSNQLALNANADLFSNGQVGFSSSDIQLHEAYEHAKQLYKETFDSLVLRIVSGEQVAIKGLQHLIKKSAIELNSSGGFNH
jgi:hypothetical protein